jgi:hypothetical protein
MEKKTHKIPHGHRKNTYARVIADKKKAASKKAARKPVRV